MRFRPRRCLQPAFGQPRLFRHSANAKTSTLPPSRSRSSHQPPPPPPPPAPCPPPPARPWPRPTPPAPPPPRRRPLLADQHLSLFTFAQPHPRRSRSGFLRIGGNLLVRRQPRDSPPLAISSSCNLFLSRVEPKGPLCLFRRSGVMPSRARGARSPNRHRCQRYPRLSVRENARERSTRAGFPNHSAGFSLIGSI